MDVQIHRSALKHGLTKQKVADLWFRGFEDTWLDSQDPTRLLRISIDSAGRPWELVGLDFDGDERALVIHTMRLRKSTITLIEGRGQCQMTMSSERLMVSPSPRASLGSSLKTQNRASLV